MPNRRTIAFAACAALLITFAPIAESAVAPELMPEIRLENGKFEPAQLIVPAESSFKVKVTNRTSAAIEFESFELHRERVVRPGETITVFMPPLHAGTYPFFDDFNHAVPRGAIVVK